MEQINVAHQRINSYNLNTGLSAELNQIGKSAKLRIPYDENKILSAGAQTFFTNSASKMGPVVRAPKDFWDEFAPILSKLYGTQDEGNGNVFKSIFGFIKKIATKLGGWDKLLNIILALPLPAHVKVVLEILKGILPLLSPTAQNSIGNMIQSTLSLGSSTNSPEELLQKINESAMSGNQIKNSPDTANINSSSPQVNDFMADKNLSLEDKVMAVLMTLAEKQEKEILDQAAQLDKSSNESRERGMIELQVKVQKLSQTFESLSNLLKVFHETAMNSVRNIR